MTFDLYNKFIKILEDGIDCRFCGRRLSPDNIDMYDHDDGIEVPDHDVKQWVFVQCNNKKCQYQWSFRKLLK